jgi:RHS repeat-associated protein
LGSVIAVTSNAGAILGRYAIDPWGRRTLVAGVDSTNVGYTGHGWQQSGGMWLSLYRAYDPSLGRWLSEDPQGMQDGPNLFAYVGNRSISFHDPLGLQHKPGGPWHPEPPYDKVSCTKFDTCAVLQQKISTLSDMIRAHRNWDKKRNTQRHSQDIAQLTNAIMNCVSLYEQECKPCGDNKTCKKVIRIVANVLVAICLRGRAPNPAPAF